MNAPETPYIYPGVNVVLMGPPGTGKTHALHTLAKWGLETFVLFLEPGLESLIAPFADKGQPVPSKLHWHQLVARTRSFSDMQASAQQIGKFDLKFLANYKDPKRGEYNRYEAMYGALNNFVDQSGKAWGSVDTWGNDRVICFDGLSGIGEAAMEMMTGDRIVRDKPDYGIAQNNMMNLIRKLTEGCRCHVVILAHVDRLADEVMGGVKLMPATPGRAIQSTLFQPFSDVILTKREGDKWYWDTADSTADLKTRNLAIRSKLPPDFGTILDKWKKRKLADEAARSGPQVGPT